MIHSTPRSAKGYNIDRLMGAADCARSTAMRLRRDTHTQAECECGTCPAIRSELEYKEVRYVVTTGICDVCGQEWERRRQGHSEVDAVRLHP